MNIKSLTIVVIFSATALHAGERDRLDRFFPGMGVAGAREFNEGLAGNIILGSEHGQILIEKTGEVIKKTAEATVAAALTKTSVEAYGISQAAGAGFMSGVGLKIKAAAVVAGPYAAGAVGCYAVYKGYKYFYPSEEEQLRRLKVKQEKEDIEAEQEFNQCLSSNKNGVMKLQGYPSKCSEPALKFSLRNKQKSDQMISSFKQFKQIEN